MKRDELGTKEHFEDFLLSQAKSYSRMVERHYGIPGTDYPRHYVESFELPSRSIRAMKENMPDEHVEFTTHFFEKREYAVGDSVAGRILLWFKR